MDKKEKKDEIFQIWRDLSDAMDHNYYEATFGKDVYDSLSNAETSLLSAIDDMEKAIGSGCENAEEGKE